MKNRHDILDIPQKQGNLYAKGLKHPGQSGSHLRHGGDLRNFIKTRFYFGLEGVRIRKIRSVTLSTCFNPSSPLFLPLKQAEREKNINGLRQRRSQDEKRIHRQCRECPGARQSHRICDSRRKDHHPAQRRSDHCLSGRTRQIHAARSVPRLRLYRDYSTG